MNARHEFYDKWKQYQYYVIIGVVSLIALFFLPMVGSEVGLAFVLPNTVAGWIVYITSKLLVAALNVIIFHCFILQAKINIKDNPNYLAALDLLRRMDQNNYPNPRSPQEYFREIYGKKGITIFITTILAAIGLTQAVLTFNLISMLSYLFTVLMGLIFGILQMNQTEIFWTEEFYEYAKTLCEKRVEMASPQVSEQINDTTDNIGGVDILVSPDSCRPSGAHN
jgi:hypothetical protein